jgi:hypothetical protein
MIFSRRSSADDLHGVPPQKGLTSKAMRSLSQTLPLALLLLSSSALGHATEVNLRASVNAKTFVLRASSPDGYPINGAKIEAMLLRDDGTTLRMPMREFGTQGEYGSPAPVTQPGPYTLLVRDTTFPSESLEVQQSVTWPLVRPVSFVLPPSSKGSIGWPLLFVLAGTPVVLALAFLAFIAVRQPKNSGSQRPEGSA